MKPSLYVRLSINALGVLKHHVFDLDKLGLTKRQAQNVVHYVNSFSRRHYQTFHHENQFAVRRVR